ncbi:MAG: ADP-dependent glucokinase/phosphofructokinase [Candidatus Micrarchaeota archaeon]
MLNLREVWNEKLELVKTLSMRSSVFCAFNANLSVRSTVNQENLQALINSLDSAELVKSFDSKASVLKTREQVIGFLLGGIRDGFSRQALLDEEMMRFVSENFEHTSEAMGGDAGIIANQLSALGCSVVVFTPFLSKKQASFFDSKIKFPLFLKKKFSLVSAGKAVNSDFTVEKWALNYSRGTTVSVKGKITAPLSNRVVFRLKRSVGLLSPELLSKGKKAFDARVQFLSGFHLISDLKELKMLEKQLTALPRSFRHWEYSSLNPKVAGEILKLVSSKIDSIGLNERELVEVLRFLGLKDQAKEIEAKENSFTIYNGCLALFNKLKLKRVHCHNLGYHVCVTDKTPNPEKVRDSIAAAALLACAMAEKKKVVSLRDLRSSSFLVSETGLNQVWIFESGIDPLLPIKHSSKERKAFLARGGVELKNHFVVIVPTPIIQTTLVDGLGDVVSSVALAFERS